MNAPTGEKTPSGGKEKSFFREFLDKLRKRHIIETLAAFIGGGWLILEFVDRLMVAHYHFPDETIDLTFITILAALICTILWRWFRGTEKRPGNVKVEVLLVPLIILTALCIDLNILFDIAGISGKRLLIGITALCLGIAWVIFKLYQWAASTPNAAVKKFDISKLAEAKPEKSIVVLPFKNISPEGGQDFFSDGMTEELITKLSKVLSLRVISRTSAFVFKDTQKNIRDISRELKVGYVLEGSVRKSGNKLRIAAQLIDAATDTHIWAENYDGILEDVFDMQETVSRSIVDTLQLKLTPEEKQKMAERPIENLKAYEIYLKDTASINKDTEEPMQDGIRYLHLALDIMGDNAFLYSGLAFVHLHLANIGVKLDENVSKLEEYAKRALAIDPEFPKARALLGMSLITYRGKQQDLQEAIHHLQKALVADPRESLAMLGLLWIYLWAGKPTAANSLFEIYAQVEPLSFWTLWFPGALYYVDGQYEQAIREWRRLYESYPGHPGFQASYAWALAHINRMAEALSIIDEASKATPNHVNIKLSLMMKHGIQGDRQAALQELSPDFRDWCRRDPFWSYHIGTYFALLNAKEEAFDWLENAVNRGMFNYPLFAEYDPFLEKIRGEPRFKKLMECVKYEWEHFEV